MADIAVAASDLMEARLMPLGPGTPNAAVFERLRALTPQSLFAPAAVKDIESATACLAGLWLLHDYLDEAHSLSQDVATPDGNWWHAIMHRREADYGNSKYWFRRIDKHPAIATLNERLAANQLPEWEPFAFVDRCERAVRLGGAEEQLCREMQMEEWRVLFESCRQHVG